MIYAGIRRITRSLLSLPVGRYSLNLPPFTKLATRQFLTPC